MDLKFFIDSVFFYFCLKIHRNEYSTIRVELFIHRNKITQNVPIAKFEACILTSVIHRCDINSGELSLSAIHYQQIHTDNLISDFPISLQ